MAASQGPRLQEEKEHKSVTEFAKEIDAVRAKIESISKYSTDFTAPDIGGFFSMFKQGKDIIKDNVVEVSRLLLGIEGSNFKKASTVYFSNENQRELSSDDQAKITEKLNQLQTAFKTLAAAHDPDPQKHTSKYTLDQQGQKELDAIGVLIEGYVQQNAKSSLYQPPTSSG